MNLQSNLTSLAGTDHWGVPLVKYGTTVEYWLHNGMWYHCEVLVARWNMVPLWNKAPLKNEGITVGYDTTVDVRYPGGIWYH